MAELQQQRAIAEWCAALGDAYVVRDLAPRAAAERATFETSQKIPGILRPRDRQQVCEVLRIANRYEVALYPVSSGKNWGYGSRVPVVTGCALLDLSRMDEIVDFSEELGYVTVQPGVTQQALFEFLASRKSKLWMDATGSSPECSLIGNAMERGFGHTPYGDHFSYVCGLEVVLPDGAVIETGFSGLGAAKTGPVYRWGMGPSLDGLFSQSNLGIVTRMTVWLMPAPEYFQAFFFQCAREEDLAPVIDALRPLRLNGTIRSAVHIGNDYKVMGGIQQFPWGEEMPLTPERMKFFQRELKFSRWSGSGALYGTAAQVKEQRRLIREALAGKTERVRFLDDRTIRLATRFTRPYKFFTGLDLSKTLELVRPVYGLLKGVPTEKTLGSAYWRKRMAVPADPNPDRDGCGLLWCAPVARMEGKEAEKLTGLAERILLGHGFEPMISITLLTERSLACVISITYDRDVPGEDAKAMACYRELQEQLESAGYYSYRLGIAGMGVQGGREAYSEVLAKIKQALDPNSILAPGRYVPASEIKVGMAS
jgi:4-cresol dehydrogenase (hydroxylating)